MWWWEGQLQQQVQVQGALLLLLHCQHHQRQQQQQGAQTAQGLLLRLSRLLAAGRCEGLLWSQVFGSKQAFQVVHLLYIWLLVGSFLFVHAVA